MNIREVVLNGGYPWGFRIAGGAEFQQPLRVSKANRGSSAASKGVQEGDLIASINDVNATDITNSAAHDLLKGPGSVLKLQLNKGACQLPKDRRPTFANQRSAELKSVLGSTTEFKKHDISPVSTLSSSGSALAESRRAVFEEVGSDRVATPKFDLITFGCAKRQKEMSSVSRRAHATTYKVSEGSDLNGHLQADLEIIEHTTGLSNKHALLDDSLTNYKVESPELLRKKRKASKSAPIVKSKSLDDDDVKITEITSDSEDKCSTEFNAIVTEDDSDVEWETTEELAKNVVKVDAVETSFSPLKDSVIEDVVIIYPQDESDSPPSPKKPRCPKRGQLSKSEKRDALTQYFFPVLHNPTFLEVINEETSDLSDREQKQKESPGNAPEEVIQSDWNITFVNSALGAEVVYLEDNETEPDAKQTDEVPEESQSIDQLPSEGSEESQETDQLSKDNSSEENETDSDVEVKQTNCDILNEDLENVCTDSSYQKCDVTRSESVSPVTTSSGQSTSQCTERYIPLSASVGDVASILKSEESPEDHHDPLPLKDLCLLRLTSSPYGVDVLQELADVSSSIEATIRNITLKQEVNAKDSHLPAFMSTDYQRPFKSLFKGCNASFNLAATEPKLQMSEVKVNGISQNERFITVERENQDLSGRRLGDGWSTLPTSTKKNRSIKEQNENHFLYYVENVSNKSREKMCSQPDVRLNARSLAEWLHMARSEDSPGFNKMQNLCDSGKCDRRFSLPNELYEFHRLSILQQEKEIELEIKWLEEEKKRLTEMADAEDKKARKTSRTFPMAPAEFFRQKMYDEYMRQLAAREDRKLNKVIKVSSPPISDDTTKGSRREAIRISGIEEEFMSRVKERMSKLGMSQDDANRSESCNEEDDGEPVLVIDGRSLKNSKTLPKHIRELLDVSCYFIDDNDETAVWSPGQSVDSKSREISFDDDDSRKDDPIPPVWTPQSVESSPTAERKEFKPIGFRSPVLARKNKSVVEEKEKVKNFAQPPWANPGTRDLSFRDSSTHKPIAAPRLPKTQLPTITLLQKAREGQLPRGAIYIDQPKRILKHERPAPVDPGEIFYTIKQDRTETSDSEGPKKMVDLGRRKFEGIGPTTKDGMPLILRSEVKENNQSKWYKKMYDTIHKQRGSNDEYVTVKYKQNRGRYPYASGYFSEPEPTSYDSDAALSDNKYATVDRRLYSTPDVYPTSSLPKPATKRFSSSDDTIKHGQDVYKNQPGRIENYIPGRSSISEKEAKEWWSEVMDMFDGQLDQYRHVPKHRGHMSQALKESGYESDSTLVFRRREDAMNQLNPSEQKEAYKHIQKGGDVPLQGLRKPAPERPKETPRRYVENEVTIHYRSPVRQEIKEVFSEEELAKRQAEHMKQVYQEERRRKYLQELQNMNSRRHTDNFIPSQKSPIPLNRYDDFFDDDYSPKVKARPRSPEQRLVAKALFNFVGQSAKELSFHKGDIIYIKRQIDQNWYEGEHNAMVGLFPVNYIQIIPHDGIKSTPRKSHEGQAKAKFNFIAQTHLELSLAKGELVILTRRVDDNWFEGRIGGRKGIFPVSYVDVLMEPSDPLKFTVKPVAAPAAHSLLVNGAAAEKQSMEHHSFTPFYSSNQLLRNASYPKSSIVTNGRNSDVLSKSDNITNSLNEALFVDTQPEPIPYRVLYKYRPQNNDELELSEGDVVYVLEKCDDGWYVGSSQRTGAFGTFPGNYVEQI